MVRGDGNAIENESRSFVNFVDCVWLVEAMVGVFNVKSPEDGVPKYGVEAADVGIELIYDAKAILLDKIISNRVESEMVHGEVLEVVYAKSLAFAD